MPIGHEAKVTHFVQPFGQDMQHQSAQKFHRLEGAGAQTLALFMILIPERHPAVLQSHQAMIGDGDAIDIAREVFQDVLRVARLFGVDDPLLVAQRREQVFPGFGLR